MNPVNMQSYIERSLFDSEYMPQPYFLQDPLSTMTYPSYYINEPILPMQYEQPRPSTNETYPIAKPESPNSTTLSSTPPLPKTQPYYGQQNYWPESNWNQMMPMQPTTPLFSPPLFGMHPPKRVFSFVSMTHTKTKKRHRRRYEEIDRVYKCRHLSCSKSYGTLNNLNAHILMQGHGPKRSAFEFKDLHPTRPHPDSLNL